MGTAESDDEVRCVVLRGAGAHFCAGGNLQGLMARREAGPPAQARMLEQLHQWVEALRACPKPVIAAVEGAAAGAGFSLALACDLIVAAEDARFILSYAKLGLSPDGGATWHLARALPRQAGAADGLAGRAGRPRGSCRAGAWCRRCAAPGQALGRSPARWPIGWPRWRRTRWPARKELLNSAAERSLNAQLAAERDHFIVNLFHANGGEGLQAFVDKRAPRFE